MRLLQKYALLNSPGIQKIEKLQHNNWSELDMKFTPALMGSETQFLHSTYTFKKSSLENKPRSDW